jgi:glucose-6-phosphate 1-dehydrogenase
MFLSWSINLRTIPPLDPKHLVRGQFNGYKKEKGVAPESKVETFAALRLDVHSWRWSGVPFLIRAGKCLPVTTTEVLVKLRKPPLDILGDESSNLFRFRLGPGEISLRLRCPSEATRRRTCLQARASFGSRGAHRGRG